MKFITLFNSDSKIFEDIAKKNNINFFLRPKKLGSSNAHSDEVVNNFLTNIECERLFWINPIAPLQNYKQIKNAVPVSLGPRILRADTAAVSAISIWQSINSLA